MVKINNFIVIVILLLAALLRFTNLASNPPALFADEVDAGYQAYSLLKTGRDYSGNFFPTSFKSTADYRAPLFIYSLVPTIYLFGLNEWGVRLPSAFFGLLTVAGVFFLTRQLKLPGPIPQVSAAIIALSPWHLHYSRVGFEVSLMLCLIVWGVIFFLKGLEERKFLLPTVVLLALSLYSYSTAKLFTPLLALSLIVIYFKELVKIGNRMRVAVLLGLVLLVPLAFDTISGKGGYRFSYTSIFSNPTIPKEVDVSRAIDNQTIASKIGQGTSLSSKVTHNKITYFTDAFVNNYLSSFSTSFLFLKGDGIGRHSVGGMGQLYMVEAVFLLLGLYAIKKYPLVFKTLFAWLILAPIPSALTVEGGMHATRLFQMVVPLEIISAAGLSFLIINFGKLRFILKFLVLVLLIFFSINIYNYFHRYYIHYPTEQERLWHFGFKQAIEKVNSFKGQYKKIIFSPTFEQPQIFIAFWDQINPQLFQKGWQASTLANFGQPLNLGQYYITSLPSNTLSDKLHQIIDHDTLLLVNRKDVPADLRSSRLNNMDILDIINYPSGEVAFYLLVKSKGIND